MNKKIICLITAVMLFLTINIYAISPTQDTITNAGKKHAEKLNILDGAFNMCECVKYTKINYIVTDNQARKICWKSIEACLMKKSKESNQIETVIIIGCEGE